jgi:hypothetical protein
MAAYEVLLSDWREVRLTDQALEVGEHVEIANLSWLVVGVADTDSADIRYLCVRHESEAVR